MPSSSKTPQFQLRSGQGVSSNLNFVTTSRVQSLSGTVDPLVVDVQVNYNGQGFKSDPTLIHFDQGSFTFPNPQVYPDGIELDWGRNVIELRAIDNTGALSDVAKATIEILKPDFVQIRAEVPTGLRVRRKRDSVEIVWAKDTFPYTKGYNVYASTESGGGSVGYTRINRDLITTASFSEDITSQVGESITLFENSGGQLRVKIDEEDFNDEVLQNIGDSTIDISLASDDMIVRTEVSSITTREFCSFTHDRNAGDGGNTINNDIFFNLPTDEPAYYVITSVAYDPVLNQEVESSYSMELVGLPITIDTQLREIPRRTRFDVSEDYITKILNYDNEISVIPGSVVRDVFIDPFSTEAERLYFIADFIRRSQAFPTLLVVDQTPSYKAALGNALGLTSNENVQNIIDDSFDKLAGNVGITRLGSTSAVGEVIFYTTTEPQNDIPIPEGTLVSTDSSGQTFRVTSRVVLRASQKDSHYNHQRRRWEIRAGISATLAGSQGNVASGRIRNIIGGLSSMQVFNPNPLRFGSDEESNEALATRAILAFSSVDVGTKAGYLATTLKNIGVQSAKVVVAGHPLMMRDYDDLRQKHIGGKVDVYVRGDDTITISDTFAFPKRIERDIRFYLVSNPSEYIFTVDHPELSEQNPIGRILGALPNEIAQNLRMLNVTTGEYFNITNHEVIAYNLFKLDTSLSQPSVNANDEIVGAFLFRPSNRYIFSRQPALSVESVTSLDSQISLVEGEQYLFNKTEDPLLLGNSTKGSDSFEVLISDTFPSGESYIINDERRFLLGEIPEPLSKLGVSPLSVRVFSIDRTVEYNPPSSQNPDFFIDGGSDTEHLMLIRNSQGNIANGQEVSVDYEHDENYEVSYTTSNILNNVQNALDKMRHITADVVAKEVIKNKIDLEMVIALKSGSTQAQVDPLVRAAMSHYFQGKKPSESIHQSDIVHSIEGIRGVDWVVVPFFKMTHGDGNLIIREPLTPTSIRLWEGSSHDIYLLNDPTLYPTINEGGLVSSHKGVFKNDQALDLGKSFFDLQMSSNTAFIIGKEGIAIQGYTDGNTLSSQGYTTTQQRAVRRAELTGNRVLVSLPKGENPDVSKWNITYQVFGASGSLSTIDMQDTTCVDIGAITITYKERGAI